MKKKIIVLFLLVALIASISLTGCTMVKLNEERQANEVLATVSLKDSTLSLDLTRNELLAYVNYMISLYSQYSSYGITYDVSDLIDSGVKTLVAQKYAVMEGMIYLSGLEHRQGLLYKDTDEYKAIYGDTLVPEGFLTIAERYAAIASTNETFEKSIKEYMESYETEVRDREVSAAREKLASLYNRGYAVAEDTDDEKGVSVVHKDEEDNYVDGLYAESFVKGSDDEIDYTKVILKLVLKKDNAKETVYLPIASTAIERAVDEETESDGKYVTAKVATFTYDEPVQGENDSYNTHTVKVNYTLVTPRTSWAEPKEEDTRDEATIANEGDVKYRYNKFEAADVEANAELAEIVEKGQIFVHTKSNYESKAEEDAYRQFREAKKNMNIYFDESDKTDPYNTLGYYYKSSFESAVLTAVQFELKKSAVAEISDEEMAGKIDDQYATLLEKQKEEYSVLSAKAQIEKFAETIKTDLTSAYYVPIEALTSETFLYNGEDKTYAVLNEDGTYTIDFFYIAHILFGICDESSPSADGTDHWTCSHTQLPNEYLVAIGDRSAGEVKELKIQFIDEEMTTNKSKLDFATAEEMGETLESAFETVVDEDENVTIRVYKVGEVINELKEAMEGSENPFDVFKEYTTYFNDDSGTFTKSTGYMIPVGDITSGWDAEFTNTAIDFYYSLLAKGIDPNETDEISDYALSTYGVHVETISFAPFYHVDIDENGGLGANFVIDRDGTTFADSIKDTIVSRLETDKYSEWRETFSDEIENNSSINDKKISALKKDLGV